METLTNALMELSNTLWGLMGKEYSLSFKIDQVELKISQWSKSNLDSATLLFFAMNWQVYESGGLSIMEKKTNEWTPVFMASDETKNWVSENANEIVSIVKNEIKRVVFSEDEKVKAVKSATEQLKALEKQIKQEKGK